MAFSFPGFMIGRALAERRGVDEPDRVNRVGVIAGLTGASSAGGFSPVGVVVADQLALREAEEEAPVPATDSPAPEPQDEVYVKIPDDVIGGRLDEVMRKLSDADLDPVARLGRDAGVEKDLVIELLDEDEDIVGKGQLVKEGSTIYVIYSAGSEEQDDDQIEELVADVKSLKEQFEQQQKYLESIVQDLERHHQDQQVPEDKEGQQNRVAPAGEDR